MLMRIVILAWSCILGLLGTAAAGRVALAEEEPPTEWIEPATGHWVVRLSQEPGSASLYFHQYAFSADGKKLVFTSPSGICAVDLATRYVERVVEGPARVLVTGRKTGDVYYVRYPRRGGGEPERPDRDGPRQSRRIPRAFWPGGDVYAANLDTHVERHVAKLPDEFGGSNVAVSADETTLVAIGRDPAGEAVPRAVPGGSIEGRLLPNWASGAPRLLYTIDIASGKVQAIHRSNDWLNHLQCSPTDPEQIMFCHEGPWHYVDRVWLIRGDGSGLTRVHRRTMDMEIAGHEFFSSDGRSVWYDLQTPRSLVFWLAKYDIVSGARTWYHVERSAWSVHYNLSPDGTLLAGDGGGPASVANRTPNHEPLDPPGNGQWIYLFRPELIAMTGLPAAAEKQIKVGLLKAERLVDLSKHDYDLEPNVMFTPDGKWIVFRSNMHGPSHVYMAEVRRSKR
jgi:oligogalacturonide lyase